MMDCTLTLWADKSLSFPKIATILCFVLTRKVAKSSGPKRHFHIWDLCLQGVHELLWKYMHKKRTQDSGSWVAAGTGNPGFLYSGSWATWGPIMNVRVMKHLVTLKGFKMCANENLIQNPTGNASIVSQVALAYVTLPDLTTAWTLGLSFKTTASYDSSVFIVRGKLLALTETSCFITENTDSIFSSSFLSIWVLN